MLLNYGVGEDSWESLRQQGDPTSPSLRKSVMNIHWKDWWWSWNSNTLASWCEELTLWKRPWCWERFKAGREGDNKGWDGWMALLTQWTWVWVNSRSQWWTGRPGLLQSMGSQRVGHNWATELNWAQTLTSSLLNHWNNFKNGLLSARMSLSKSLSGFGTLLQMALCFPAFYVFFKMFKLFWCLETSFLLPYPLLKVLNHFLLSSSNSMNHTQLLLPAISLIPKLFFL